MLAGHRNIYFSIYICHTRSFLFLSFFYTNTFTYAFIFVLVFHATVTIINCNTIKKMIYKCWLGEGENLLEFDNQEKILFVFEADFVRSRFS